MKAEALDVVIEEFRVMDTEFAEAVAARTAGLSMFVDQGTKALVAKAKEVQAALAQARTQLTRDFAELEALAAALRVLALRIDPPPDMPQPMVLTPAEPAPVIQQAGSVSTN